MAKRVKKSKKLDVAPNVVIDAVDMPCVMDIVFDKPLTVKTDEALLAALETGFGALRDRIDEIKERINVAEIAPRIGTCYRYVHRNRETNKVEQTDYYKVLRGEGYQTLFFFFSVASNGVVNIEPEHRGGTYIFKYPKDYKPIGPKFFRGVYDATLGHLAHQQI